jgi:hypothetical protein
MLKEQKNQKIELSREQGHPNESFPEDFQIGTPADNAKSTVPGCFGDLTEAEYAQVKRESSELHTPSASDKSGLATHPRRK